MWTDLIGKTPHFLLWFWCDVSLALTPSWTLWELLGIERLIGVFELGDLIECSCHNISNTVYSPIMTQLCHDGHITKKTTRGKKKWKSISSAVKWFIFFFPAEPPFATATLITENYFSSSSFSPGAFVFFWDPSRHPQKCCCALTCKKNLVWQLFKSSPSGRTFTRGSFLTRKVTSFASLTH